MSDYVEKGANVSDDEDNVKRVDDDEDSETDDHVPDQYEQNDGFIVDDDEVDEEEGYGASPSHKRRRSDDDENIGSKKKKRKREFKRLKKRNKLDAELEALRQTSDDESRMADEEVHASNTNELRQTLFDDNMDYDEEEEDLRRKKPKKKKRREDDDDDMDNFIVPTRRGHYADDDDLFGGGFVGDVGYDDEPIEDKPADTRDTLKQIFGPDEIAEQMMTEEDDKIRQTDIPERYLVKGTVREPSAEELVHEAQWIYNQVFAEKQFKKKNKLDKIDDVSYSYSSNTNAGSSFFESDNLAGGDAGWTAGSSWSSGNINTEQRQQPAAADDGWGTGGGSFYESGNQFDGADDIGEEPTLEQKYVTAITEVLKFILLSNYDIPFISQYRKEYFTPILKNDSDLWLILEYDEKWFNLQAKKQHVSDLYREAVSFPFSLDFYNLLLKEASSVEEVEDLVSHYQLHADKPQEGRKRRSSKRDLYTQAKKTQAKDFAAMFGLSSSQFSENLAQSYQLFEVKDAQLPPDQLANQYVTREYKNADAVLKVARHILAREIAAEPYVKKRVRSAYMMYGLLSVTITTKGESVANSRLNEYRSILKSSLDRFFDDAGLIQLMNVFRDERDGLVTVSIELPEDRFAEAIEYESLYFSREPDSIAQQWNDQRKMIMQEVRQLVSTGMEQNIRNHYVRKGRAKIGRGCSKALKKLLNEGPIGHANDYNPNKIMSYDPDEEEENPRPTRYRIMSCCVGIDKEMTTFVQLDADGQQKEILQWKFSVLGTRNAEAKQIVDAQDAELRDFIIRNNPHALAVAASGIPATKLFQNLTNLLDSLKSSRLVRDSVKAYYVPDDMARIYEVSRRASREFPNVANIIRRAVSVGRRLSDPLTEISGLFNYHQDLLCYKFHPLQDMIPTDQLASYLETAIAHVVNRVGVDINRIVSFKNLQSPLRFISGLGPRKADYIIKTMTTRSRGYITRRKALVETVENGGVGLGKVVFTNCAGFIRVVPPPGAASNDFDVMDNTRIHFESNKLAMKVAMDALDIEDEDEEEEIQSSIENVMKAPEKLDDLDLVSYADALEERKIGKKHATLNDIREELKDPFKDPRDPFVDLTDTNVSDRELEYRKDKLFQYITGETNDTFKVGMIVPVMIQRAVEDRRNNQDDEQSEPQKYYCQLDNGLRGILRTIETQKEIKPGSTIDCTIEEIDKGTFTVILACRDKDIEEIRNQEKLTTARPSRTRSKRPKKQHKRNINHPNYKNFNYGQALTYLADKPLGEAVIRPSSKGPDHLAVTFRFYKDQFINLDLKEEDKIDQNSLGRRLRLKDRTYSDLDEIVVRYVTEVMEFSKKIFEHPKFVDQPIEAVEKILQQEKQKNPKSIPYRLAINTKHMGRFVILFMPNKRVKKQNMSVSPDGYVFNQRTFGSITQLLNAFKKTYSTVQGVKVASSSSARSSNPYSSSSGHNWDH